jgi:hypothetical protein
VVTNVWWGSPAFQAGITPSTQLVSVDGVAYTPAVLAQAIAAAESDKHPLQLQLRDGDDFKTFSLPYYGGLRYPSLQRIPGTPGRLDDILKPSQSPLPAM